MTVVETSGEVTGSDDRRITATELAERIDVGLTTVSNWRRRHADFPAARRAAGRTAGHGNSRSRR
ncbi:hypothetical protein AHOG_04805 [Actinoalloteichus hoggarensis]|uniref:Uncharacterized protein n=1 Tax=Actinoalloteichus hoggarensis TaxID=1470176 RepID=A0A221VYJ8_9PSEU|nr:hypothetical protein AHOG_04805 [Actinoalloteichus hoggarensis]